MNEGSAASNGSDHVNGFRHLRQVGSFFQTGLGIGIDAVGALNGMSDRQSDKGFFAFGQFAFCKYSIIIFEKFTRQFGCLFSD